MAQCCFLAYAIPYNLNDKVLDLLTLHTLILEFIFSTLFHIHSLWYRQGEVSLAIKAS